MCAQFRSDAIMIDLYNELGFDREKRVELDRKALDSAVILAVSDASISALLAPTRAPASLLLLSSEIVASILLSAARSPRRRSFSFSTSLRNNGLVQCRIVAAVQGYMGCEFQILIGALTLQFAKRSKVLVACTFLGVIPGLPLHTELFALSHTIPSFGHDTLLSD
ncbi:hypothetical protein WOLCODRAFT_166091 [Wolfiporia cocos MD-104 SS10]|uniref:Uncharacterized protein n=1 Tax=Wolfiporia cocos (strain MD-104) TaxID=742152 RepID=A0A2H3J8U8_WOLCO|nr:hypothetical protein WOLCODRAFT_166091 [Wolfiporia cocos MD-104 SS10]